MTDCRPPHGLEFKAPVLEAPPGFATSPPEPATGPTDVDPDIGTVTLIGAVTGVVDDVGDVLVAGCFGRSLRTRTPALCVAHDWGRVAGRVLSAVELLPGDPRLPRTAPDGSPWPRKAGALLVRARYLLGTREGREAYEVAKAYGNAMCYSIGYRVTPGGAKHRDGVRYIYDLDLFEVSGVLHGANRLSTQLDLKSAAGAPGPLTRVECAGGCGRHAMLSFPVLGQRGFICSACLEEASDGLADALAGYRAGRPDADEPDAPEPAAIQTECSVCGLPGGIVAAAVPRGATVVCADCTGDVRDDLVDALARFGERELGAEESYISAVELEQAHVLLGDGTLEPASTDPTRGAAWTRTTRGGWGTP